MRQKFLPAQNRGSGPFWVRTFAVGSMEAEPGKPEPLEEALQGAAAMVLPDNPTAKPWQSPEPWVGGGEGQGAGPPGYAAAGAVRPVWASLWAPHTKSRSGPWGISQIYYR